MKDNRTPVRVSSDATRKPLRAYTLREICESAKREAANVKPPRKTA